MGKRFAARFTKEFEIDKIVYRRGDTLVLEESVEYAPALWIVRNDERSNDMLTNEYGIVYEIVAELEQAA